MLMSVWNTNILTVVMAHVSVVLVHVVHVSVVTVHVSVVLVSVVMVPRVCGAGPSEASDSGSQSSVRSDHCA